jgi:SPOR domain
MSESAKSRFAVDLGEFERQIAQAHNASAQSTPAGRNDPLAELARIVGQDDPFQSMLANNAPARPRNQASASLDDIFATREPVAPAARAAQPQSGRGGVEMPAYDPYAQQPQSHAGHQGYGYQAAPSQGQGGYDQAEYADEYYDDHAGQHAGQYEQSDDMHYDAQRKPRSRKGILAIGAVAGAIVLGAGGAFLLGGNTTALTGGEPPLIKASADPVKVQPQNPGGVEIPNQNKQIYERADQSGDTKVVNREEQPVDVKQAVRINGGNSAESTGATAPHAAPHAQQQAGGLNLGEPRKVRTVAIRPDGTTARPEGQQPPRPSPVPTMALPAAAQATPAANVAQAAPAQPRPAATTPAATPAPKPVAAAATPASDASPQRVASVQPVAPAAAPEVTATGGFAVQLGVSGSESQAQSALEQYQRKYSDLEGLPPLIRKAEVNGNTVYRVRVGPMSRDEASSLCSKLQGQGGQCFVAKN